MANVETVRRLSQATRRGLEVAGLVAGLAAVVWKAGANRRSSSLANLRHEVVSDTALHTVAKLNDKSRVRF
jgi:hypothetical protein